MDKKLKDEITSLEQKLISTVISNGGEILLSVKMENECGAVATQMTTPDMAASLILSIAMQEQISCQQVLETISQTLDDFGYGKPSSPYIS